MIKHILLAILLSVLPFQVMAQDPIFIKEYKSTEHQTMDNFVLSIARDMIMTTRIKQNSEICGEIEEDNGSYVLKVYSIRERKSCSYVKTIGSNYTGQVVHTHGTGNSSTFSDEDYAFHGYLITAASNVQHQEGRGTERRVIGL